MSYLRFILILLLYTFTSLGYSQLTDFNLSAIATDETCTNNGTIEMSVTNTTSGSIIIYRLYLAPDFSTSIAETSGTQFTSLSAGNYRVIATQGLDGLSNSQTEDLVINDLTEILDFEISDSGGTDCALTAVITIDILSGNAALYEILSGPVTVPLQASNEFANLPSGEYLIRVFDECGDALSKAYTLVLENNELIISPPVLPDVYTSCTSIEITNQITTNSNSILYPLLVNYTVFAPDGSVDQNYSQTISSGPTTVLELTQEINLFGNQLFTVKIEITDNCNNIFSETFEINPNPKLTYTKFQDDCGNPFFTISITNYLPPFTLDFTEPSNFDPLLFNADYPGPYTSSTVPFGDIDNTVPFGTYKLSTEDACGRTANLTFSLTVKPITPIVTASNNGCNSSFGKLTIKIATDRTIVSIFITEAPAEYVGNLPSDVFSMVDVNGVYNGLDLPVGDYTFEIIDNCGYEYTITVTIPEFVFSELVAETRPTCSALYGSVKISTGNGPLTNVTIISAPPNYLQILPQNVSFNIDNIGVFYMSDLPAGTYTFSTIDECGFSDQITVEILGYTSNSDGFSINRKCGSFDITLNDTDTSITGKSFWLQKFNSVTNTWGHPYSGAAYTEGSIPNSTNATQISNPGTLLNIFLLGDFRILKVFETFNNGNPNGKCVDLYTDFIISAELLISGVYNLNCIGGNGVNDLVIDVIGVEPIVYQITSPYFFDNGTNNVFENLAQGIYNILATDDCGNIKNISIEIGTLLPLARATKPTNLLECRDDGIQFSSFILSNQTPQILGNQEPSKYIVTYHLNQSDADTGDNPLPDGYTNISNPQTIYVRVEHKSIKLCYATTSFILLVGSTPILTDSPETFLCYGFTAKLTADNGFEAYEWSTGETTQSIIVNQPGTYTVTIKNLYDDFSCDASKDFIVTNSGIATIESIETSDWSAHNNSATVNVSGIGNYVYSLDDIHYQSSNTFSNLLPGFYTVYVKDLNGCGKVKGEFVLLNYPKYFTPNGDGFNDTWQIKFSSFEPTMNVDIFDRYGKFLIRLKGGEVGWDGTYNGQDVVSTDYWFVVTREDGKVYRGHFSLKR